MRPFFDSNVIVYALSGDGDPRCDVAQSLLAQAVRAGRLVLSVQVLTETYHVLTRKKRADPAAALAAVQLFSRHEVVSLSAESALLAMALSGRHGLSAWDALIVQAALDAGCDTLFSEDLQAGRQFGPLQVVNPFAPAAHEAPVDFAAAATATANHATVRAAAAAVTAAAAAAVTTAAAAEAVTAVTAVTAAPAPRAPRRPPAHPAPPAPPPTARRR